MRINRVTIEMDDGTTYTAEGRAIAEFSIDRQYGTEQRKEFGGQHYTGERTVTIALKAICRYWVKPEPVDGVRGTSALSSATLQLDQGKAG